MFTYREWFRKNFFQCLATIVMAGLAAAPAGAFGPDSCQDVVWVEPGGEWSGYGDGHGEVLAFDVLSRGYFGLQASAPAASAAEPQLVALGRGCTGDGRGATVLRRYLFGYLLWVEEPGTYFFLVRSQDPGEPLGEVEVTSRFAGMGDLGRILAKDVGEGEDDPDPLVPPGYCEVGDDHADTFDCATDLILGEPASGELHLQDVDMFTFVLNDQATVRVESAGEIDVIGSLYDENGQRLALDDDGGRGENFQITRTLAAGRYFVKVEGHGTAEGPYSLSGELLAW